MSLPDPVADGQFYDGVRARRLAAFVVDLLVILVLLGGVAVIGTFVGLVTLGLAMPFVITAMAFVGLAYRTTMVMERSATLGMMLFGIELRNAQGERLDRVLAFVHAGLFTAALYLPPLLVASLLVCLVNPRGQMLHDLMAGTAMINRPD